MKARPDEKYNRLILSSLPCDASALVGMTFLKKIFCDTKMRVDPKAQMRPNTLDADMSDEHASMTPRVRGRSETYVAGE